MSISIAIKSLIPIALSNQDLMLGYAQSGKQELLSRLYDNCSKDLYHFLLTMTDSMLAKDVSQKTWLKVIEKRHLYQSTGKFEAWLFTLARHTLLDELKRTKRLSEVEMTDEALPVSSVNISTAQDMSSAFNAALERLPFVQRECFCLQQEGFSLQEIADITRSSVETTKSRLRYAKKALRDQLETFHEQ